MKLSNRAWLIKYYNTANFSPKMFSETHLVYYIIIILSRLVLTVVKQIYWPIWPNLAYNSPWPHNPETHGADELQLYLSLFPGDLSPVQTWLNSVKTPGCQDKSKTKIFVIGTKPLWHEMCSHL